MPPPPIPSAAKNPSGWRWAFYILGGFGVLMATLLVGRHLYLSAKIKTKLAEIRAAKEPVTLQELDSYYNALPLDTNGAKLYKEAISAVRIGGSYRFLEGAIELPKGTNALQENLRQTMEKVVTDSKNAFDPLRKAAACGPSRFPIDYTNGWWMLLPQLHEIQDCARLELCKGVLDDESGDVNASIQSVDLICKYADSLNSEPDLVSILTQQKIDYQAYDLSLWLLNHRNLSPAQLTILQKIFRNRGPAKWTDSAIVGERCSTLALFYSKPGYLLTMTTSGEPRLSDALAVWFARFVGQGKLDELTYLERLDDIRATARLPFPESLNRADSLETDIRNEARSKVLFATGSFLPSFLKSFSRDAEHTARLHLIQTALALEQYRIEHQTLPPDLDSLKLSDPSILIDPFDGDRLGYEASGQGYMLYSIGPDREDDGGKTSVPLYSKEQVPRGDFTASVQR